MRHVTIDYGIDLGTTNSAICRMENGIPTIIRSDSGMETMPSCISFKKGGVIQVGQSAYVALAKDKQRALKKGSALASNSCIEFKRYMGSDMTFTNVNIDHGWTPEELSARVVSALCSFVTDDKVEAAVITVPAKFTVNQKDATLEAARLSGIKQVELLQEPIAASMAYGLKAEEKNGKWMVFDFGGGTLDVALVHVSDGIMQVYDTEGDNYLGGKNLDEAIVSKLIIPQLVSQYSIDLTNRDKYALLFDALKVEAEKLKNKLSYCDQETLFLEAGDWGEDEDGEEIEMEITINRQQLELAIKPILQKAVDVCHTLMDRNGLSYGDLSHLILIGGPTHIPLLRSMLKETVTPIVETGIDPMTAVATGAAIYASTLPIKVSSSDLGKETVKFDIDFEATTVDTFQLIPVKIDGEIPQLSVKFVRRSDGWESQTAQIESKGGLIEVELIDNQPNTFRVAAYINNEEVKCFPSEITIVQGARAGSAILPYNIGIEVFNPRKERTVFTSMTGLEKNRPLPAVGNVYGLKTMCQLRPGKESDKMSIAVYQGDDNAEGKTVSLFEYVSAVEVSGDDIASYIPKGSIVNIKIEVDRSEMMMVTADFIDSKQVVEKKLDTSLRQHDMGVSRLSNQIDETQKRLGKLFLESEDDGNIRDLMKTIGHIAEDLRSGAQHKQVEQHLKEILRKIEDYEDSSEWTRFFKSLKSALFNLVIEGQSHGDPMIDQAIESYKAQVERVNVLKDMRIGKALKREIENLEYKLSEDARYRSYIWAMHANFATYEWTNSKQAQKLIQKGVRLLQEKPCASVAATSGIVEGIAALVKKDKSISDTNGDDLTTHRIDLPSM